jgi:hypothetical protein
MCGSCIVYTIVIIREEFIYFKKVIGSFMNPLEVKKFCVTLVSFMYIIYNSWYVC